MSSSFALPYATPESQGLSSAAILAFVEALESKIDSPNSVILVRHGHIVAEGWWRPFAPEYRHMLFSLSKSFTSTAVGLAVSEGLMSVGDTVVSYFPDELPEEISPNLAAMQVRHLLSMSTGHAVDTTEAMRGEGGDPNWARAFLARPVEHEPGTVFVYNSGATYMLSAIVQKVTGQKVIDFLTPRLFKPLGITDPVWEECPRGINTGGWGLSVHTSDIARFGQLYLQKGQWQGRQLIPAEWVAEATTKHISNESGGTPDWQSGYAYQFWRCRHNAYRADGAFGQYCVVMQDQDAVLAMNDGTTDLQGILDLAWEHLLPAMKAEPLAPDVEGQARLAAKLKSLELPVPEGAATSATAERVNGRSYVLEENALGQTTAQFTFSPGGSTLRLAGGADPIWVGSGYGIWMPGEIGLIGPRALGKVAAAGAWAGDNTYVSQVWAHETPFRVTVTSQFEDDRVTIRLSYNVGIGPSAAIEIKGRLQ